MIKNFMLFVLVGFFVISCGTEDKIPGTYVRNYSFQVNHPETGIEIGTRTIRDTIFVKRLEENYEISNHKWRLNDYDEEGWRNMEHAEDRGMPTFIAIYNADESTLVNDEAKNLYFESDNETLYLSKELSYRKIEE